MDVKLLKLIRDSFNKFSRKSRTFYLGFSLGIILTAIWVIILLKVIQGLIVQ
jgi:hypothetical protein